MFRPPWPLTRSAAKVLLVAVLQVTACAPSSYAPPSLDKMHYLAAREQALASLIKAYGAFTLRSDAKLGTLAFLEFAAAPHLPPPARSTSLSTSVRDFVLRYRPLFGLYAADTLEPQESAADELGMQHVSFRQKRSGVAVWGSHLSAHLRRAKNASGDNELVRLSGHLFALPMLSTAPAAPNLSAEAARQQALMAARSRVPVASLNASSPALYYHAAGDELALAYRIEVYGQTALLPVRWAYFIDAHSGAVRAEEELVARLDVTVPLQGHGRGALGTDYTLSIGQRGDTYLLLDPTRGSQRTTAVSPAEKLPGKTVSSRTPDHFDQQAPAGAEGLAVDLHAHLATLWDYFATHHGRFGWDGAGHGMVAVAHLGERANLALFDGERLLFGDGDGRDYAPLGAALDVVAHEYVHAVIRTTANLANGGESGELDEGFSDLLACLIENTVRKQDANWTLGEEVYHPSGRPGALADLRNPKHRVGHAGYLLSQRLGITRTAAIVYRALDRYLYRYADLAAAQDALVASAQDLYGNDAVTAVQASWPLETP